MKDDPIFDKYVEKEDDGALNLLALCDCISLHCVCLGVEPRKQRDNDVDIFVNLFATQEDRAEVRCMHFSVKALYLEFVCRQGIRKILLCEPEVRRVHCR